jgi:hypothetical protein
MPVIPSKAQAPGTGCVVSIGGVTGGTDTFVAVGEVSNAKFSGAKRGVIEVTNFDSGGIAQKLGTVLDSGQVHLSVVRVPNDPGQLAVIAAFNAQPAVAYDFKVVLPINAADGQVTTGDTITFSAIVSSAGDFDIEISKEATFDFVLDITGAKTYVAGA